MHILVFADLLGSFGINTLAFISQLISFGIVFLISWVSFFVMAAPKLIQGEAIPLMEGLLIFPVLAHPLALELALEQLV